MYRILLTLAKLQRHGVETDGWTRRVPVQCDP
jgi:hypothetical protein